jgi:hypothetical protein
MAHLILIALLFSLSAWTVGSTPITFSQIHITRRQSGNAPVPIFDLVAASQSTPPKLMLLRRQGEESEGPDNVQTVAKIGIRPAELNLATTKVAETTVSTEGPASSYAVYFPPNAKVTEPSVPESPYAVYFPVVDTSTKQASGKKQGTTQAAVPKGP